MKFRTDYTKCGSEILSVYGPDSHGEYAGIVENSDGDIFGVCWDEYGIHVEYGGGRIEEYERFDLATSLVPGSKSHPKRIK